MRKTQLLLFVCCGMFVVNLVFSNECPDDETDNAVFSNVAMIPASAGDGAVGEIRIAVIMIKFQDAIENPALINSDTPATAPLCRSLLFDSDTSVNAFIRESSFGKTWLTGDVLGPYVVPVNTPTASDAGACLVFDEVVAAADADIDYNSYDVLMIFYPRTRNANGAPINVCGFQGKVGSLDSTRTADGDLAFKVIWINGYLDLHIAAHELGHILGLGHAHGYRPATPKPNSAASEFLKCGDPYSVMGYNTAPGYTGPGHFGAREKYLAGWLEASNVLEVTEFGAYRVTLTPIEEQNELVKTVILPKSTGVKYFLEFRRPRGFDRHLHNTNGLLVEWGSVKDSMSGSRRVYASHDRVAFPLAVGETFYDRFARIQVTPVSMSDTALVVDVVYGQPNVALSMDNYSWPGFVHAGQILAIDCLLANDTAFELPDSIYLALKVQDVQSGENSVVTRRLAGLKAGERRIERLLWSVPRKPGAARVALEVDYYDRINESNEQDNVAPAAGSAFTITIREALGDEPPGKKIAAAWDSVHLLGNSPNPFNSSTAIHFNSPGESRVTVTIFNSAGQTVRFITTDVAAAGKTTVQWDGCDETGLAAASGLYFYRLAVTYNAQSFFAAGRMSLLK